MCIQHAEPPSVCEVFDSLPPTVSSTLTQQVAAMVTCSSPYLTIRNVDEQHQRGVNDCGLFAIAFTEELYSGNDLE